MIGAARSAATSAPGKIILMGEHAVVYGHPALVCAVDARLTAILRTRPGDEITVEVPALRIRGSGSWKDVERLTVEARLRWEKSLERAAAESTLPAPTELVVIALGEALALLPDLGRTGLHLEIASELPIGAGLGSSAALSVAVGAAACSLATGRVDLDIVRQVSLEVERRQHGTPSGVDTETVLAGGLLGARRNGAGRLAVEALPLHPRLLDGLSIFHSGDPAEGTGCVVAAVRRRREADPERIDAALEEIGRATERLREHLVSGLEPDSGLLLETIRSSERALERLGVVPPEVAAVVREIEGAGGAAKISGAGALHGPAAGCVLVHHPEPASVAGIVPPHWRRLELRLPGIGVRAEGPG